MATAVSGVLKRSAIFLHRWLGVLLCTLFLLWFPSGIAMMYWDFPSVSPELRLERSSGLEASTVVLSPVEAAAKLEGGGSFDQVRLNTFDGRPVYRFGNGPDEIIVYADTGEMQVAVSHEMMDRAASAWTGQRVGTAIIEPVEEVDQWTLQVGRYLWPLSKYSLPNGEQLYVSGATGEVVQYTTRGSRWGAYVGAIPHWLYFTPLRKHGPLWSQVVIWSSGMATCAVILGIVIGIWMLSPSKGYRYQGALTSIPYRGQKRLHMIFGLMFGLGAATWAFSGMLSMDPFPMQQGGGPSRGGDAGIAESLRGSSVQAASFAAKHPREALQQVAGLRVKELELTSFVGQPVYLATLDGGETRTIPLDGDPRAEFDRRRIIDTITKVGQVDGGVDVSVLEQYDRYYLDRRRARPLPVILAQMHDAEHTRYYVDPRTAQVVGSYSSRHWMSRWLYHGLHSLDFPWLYDYRPLWDLVVITFMVGGTALGVTSLILAWRVLGRRLTAMVGRPTTFPDSAATDDLATYKEV